MSVPSDQRSAECVALSSFLLSPGLVVAQNCDLPRAAKGLLDA